jgi:hypothetical protein
MELYNERNNMLLQDKGDADSLINNNEIMKGIEILISRGDWSQAL